MFFYQLLLILLPDFLLVVPEKDLIKLSMNIEQGMKLVISGGIITPEIKNNKKKLAS